MIRDEARGGYTDAVAQDIGLGNTGQFPAVSGHVPGTTGVFPAVDPNQPPPTTGGQGPEVR